MRQKTQKRRLITLQNLLENIQLKENKNQVGKLNVLIENKMKNQSKYFGRTSNLTPVVITNANTKKILVNYVTTKIQKYNRNTLFGIKEKKKEKKLQLNVRSKKFK